MNVEMCYDRIWNIVRCRWRCRMQMAFLVLHRTILSPTNQTRAIPADNDVATLNPCNSGESFKAKYKLEPTRLASRRLALDCLFAISPSRDLYCSTSPLRHPNTQQYTTDTTAMACPVIGTTTDVLPPNHPDVDLSKDGQIVCIPRYQAAS